MKTNRWVFIPEVSEFSRNFVASPIFSAEELRYLYRLISVLQNNNAQKSLFKRGFVHYKLFNRDSARRFAEESG